MHKGFERHLRHCLVYLTYLVKSEFAGKHRLSEAKTLQPLHLVRCAVVHLSAGMQGYGRQLHLEQRHILHDESIDACVVQIPYQATCIIELVITKYGVERHIDAHSERAGILAQACNIVDTVARSYPRAKTRRTYIDSVSTMVDGRNAALEVLCR